MIMLQINSNILVIVMSHLFVSHFFTQTYLFLTIAPCSNHSECSQPGKERKPIKITLNLVKALNFFCWNLIVSLFLLNYNFILVSNVDLGKTSQGFDLMYPCPFAFGTTEIVIPTNLTHVWKFEILPTQNGY